MASRIIGTLGLAGRSTVRTAAQTTSARKGISTCPREVNSSSNGDAPIRAAAMAPMAQFAMADPSRYTPQASATCARAQRPTIHRSASLPPTRPTAAAVTLKSGCGVAAANAV